MSMQKILSWTSLLEKREAWRQAGKTVVWTNGCFDLIHVGHVRSLQSARRFGDVLVVGVNSDTSVRKLKGPQRPVVPETERAEILAALECVTAVCIFDDDTPERPLAELRPEIHCKGEDYKPPRGKPIPEAAVVSSYGGKIEFIPFETGTSTTGLIQSIKSR
jgi:rfaE bifunctional protein nucleotidyltransferase chain/domain